MKYTLNTLINIAQNTSLVESTTGILFEQGEISKAWATNLDLTVCLDVPDIQVKSNCLVPKKVLKAIPRGHKVILIERSKELFGALKTDKGLKMEFEFPDCPSNFLKPTGWHGNFHEIFELSDGDAEAVRRLSALCHDDSARALGNVLVWKSGVVASDAHALGHETRPMKFSEGYDHFLIPKFAAKMCISGQVTIHALGHKCIAGQGQVLYFRELLDQDYPNWQAALPTPDWDSLAVTGSAKELKSIVSTLKKMTSDDGVLKVEAGNNGLRFSTSSRANISASMEWGGEMNGSLCEGLNFAVMDLSKLLQVLPTLEGNNLTFELVSTSRRLGVWPGPAHMFRLNSNRVFMPKSPDVV